MSRTALADYWNRYEIIKAAKEAGLDENDPMWQTLSSKEKWDVIKDMNGQLATKKHDPSLVLKTQVEIVSKVIDSRK